MNARVLLFASAAAIAVGGAVGAVPALALGGDRTVRSLQSGGRGMVGGGARGIQRILVGLELALAIVLAVSAVVVVRNLIDLTRVDPGFRAERVVRAQIALPSDAYESDERTFAFYDSAIQRLRGVPGFRSVAAMSGAPPLRPANNTTFALDSATVPLDHRSVPQVDFIQHVTPGYFDVMGIALRRGRAFTDADSERSAPVAIVNETLARRFWPGQSAVDRKLRPYGLGTPWFTVVGVAADVKQAGLQASPGGEFYVPYRQARRLFGTWVPRTMNIVASTAGNPAEAGPEIRSVVRALDPSAAVSNVEAMTEVISNSISQPRLIATILTAFACVALLLASVGVYGVTSAFAKARTAELGVRAALGATPARLVRHVLCASATAIIGGVCLGTAAAFAVSRFLSVLVYSPASRPSVVLNVTVGLSFSAVSLLSMIVPAVRASRVDPLTALRQL